jgi:ABC-type multidrug transport system fused ATPase/permease subunit
MFVEEVMELVELKPIRNALVGLPGVDGLSTEQRKRLTIAVELVANPSIIFMDEPTSGLDARSAAIVMRAVRNTVDTGRTVVCTIHQPSIDIFEAFDEVLLHFLDFVVKVCYFYIFYVSMLQHVSNFDIVLVAVTTDEKRRTSHLCWTSWSPFSQSN